MLAIPDSCSYTITDKWQFALMSDSKKSAHSESALTLVLSLDALN